MMSNRFQPVNGSFHNVELLCQKLVSSDWFSRDAFVKFIENSSMEISKFQLCQL